MPFFKPDKPSRPNDPPAKPAEPAEPKEDRWQRIWRLSNEIIERDRPVALAGQDDVLKEMVTEWQADIAGFTFEAKRHGDFLLLQASRSARKEAIAVNIGQADIRMHAGSEPDLNGYAEVSFKHKTTGMRTYQPDEGTADDWECSFFSRPSGIDNLMFRSHDTTKTSGDVVYGGSGTFGGDGFARSASSDAVVIATPGKNVWVYAPHTKGQAVFDAIMAAIAEGAPDLQTVTVKP